jgi:hypothetical protein
MKRLWVAMFLLIPMMNSCVTCTDGCGKGTDVVTLTFKAASFSDWKLESTSEPGIGEVGTNDPEITLEVGRRYRIINPDGAIHPFALTNSTVHGTDYLLSQGGTGSFASDTEVNYIKNTDGFTFTLTRTLAAELKSYICTAHTPMLGSVKVTGL